MTLEPVKLAPDVVKVKCMLRDILSHGDQAAIAAILGVKHQDISQRFSPDNDRKPGWIEALREGWAISVVNQDAGWKLKAYVDSLFDSWLSPVRPSEKNLTTLIREAQEGLTALVGAKLDGKPLGELREEGRAARAALDQLLAGLDLEFELKAEKFQKRA